jgi:hypothetical protein
MAFRSEMGWAFTGQVSQRPRGRAFHWGSAVPIAVASAMLDFARLAAMSRRPRGGGVRPEERTGRMVSAVPRRRIALLSKKITRSVVVVLATGSVLGIGFQRAEATVTIKFNAVYEPLPPGPTQQKFTASWTNAGWAYIDYDDGTFGPFWDTDDGSKTNYHYYPCVNGDTTRSPALVTHAGFVWDTFIQKDTRPGNCPVGPEG